MCKYSISLQDKQSKKNHKYVINIHKSKSSQNENPKDLIIVGNGFDLYCGLDSNFTDFFKYIINDRLDGKVSYDSFKKEADAKNGPIGENYYKSKDFCIKDLHLNSNKGKLSNYIKIVSGIYSRYYRNMCSKNNRDLQLLTLRKKFKNSYFAYLLTKLLKKKFTNYHNNSVSLYKCFNNSYKGNSNNFWIMYFEFMLAISNFDKQRYLTSNWSNIEHNIMLFMTRYSKAICEYVRDIINIQNSNSFINDLFNSIMLNIYNYNVENFEVLRKQKNINSNNNILFNNNELMAYFIVNISIILLIKAGFMNKGKIDNNHIQQSFYKFLFNQLKDFENLFSKYMHEMINKHIPHDKKKTLKDVYLKNAPILIDSLLPPSSSSFNLLSFNYLKLDKQKYNSISKNSNYLVTEKNIHSILKSYRNNAGHPIIGISADKCRNNKSIEPYIIFSKSFRIMSLSDKMKNYHVLSNGVNRIIFFGHSLDVNDDADYPYFESIFDKYDIYNSNVKLIFCYGVFDKGHYQMNGSINDRVSKGYSQNYYEILKNKRATSMYHKVSTLISRYEQSINHKDLWSKLLIEDRLILHCVNDKY